MNGNKAGVESTAEKAGTRKLFYGAIGLLLAGLLLLAIGALYSLPVLAGIGILGWLGAGLVFLKWLLQRIG